MSTQLFKFINRHSFVILAVIIFVLAGVLFVGDGLQVVDLIALALLVLAFTGLFRLLTVSPSKGPPARTPGEAAAGKFTLVEFYSDF